MKKRIEVTEQELKDLKFIRNYFNDHDKTQLEHLAYSELNKLVKKIQQADVISSIFLIEKIWFNTMENDAGSAVGYSPFGFVNTEDEAKQFCDKGRICTQKDCWAIWGEQKEYKYSEIKYCNKKTNCDI